MAVRTIVTCDLDGNEPAETLVFGFEGASYEVDLCAKDRDSMEKALRPYLDSARKGSNSSTRATSTGRKPQNNESVNALLSAQVSSLGGREAVNAWAKDSKRTDVKERGRLSLVVMREFIKARGEDPSA